MEYRIRRATPEDAASIVAILETVVRQRVHSAIVQVWPVAQLARYLESLSERETFQIAERLVDGRAYAVGYQSLDLYSGILPSMGHVGQLGTFLRPEARGNGIGQALFAANKKFAKKNGYSKFVIQVRSSNEAALAFYRRVGFVECGRLRDQVRIDGNFDDEVILECFL